MRILLTLLLIAGFCTCVRAQVGGNVDAEYASWCMVDSIDQANVNRFTRLVNIATLDVLDIDPVAGTSYAVLGTLYTCEAYDLRETLRDPLEDLYENCQCEYSISQENHRVKEIRGGLIQETDIEFQEVVRRKCAGQMVGVVVHRDTLVITKAMTETFTLATIWSLSSGEYIDDFNVRVYQGAGPQVTVSLDLNPNTVQASYPSLTLDPNDFEFDGTNLAAMAAAYQEVIEEAISSFGVMVNTFAFSSNDVNNTVTFSTRVLHQPASYPYLVQPLPGDSDYLNVHTITQNNPVTINEPILGASTVTNTYNEQCEGIYVEEFAAYARYDQNFPLVLQPITEIETSPLASRSNPTAFCDVSPAICAELVTDPVTVEGCVETCSDVLNIAGHLPVAGIDTTLGAQEYNSLSIYVTQGPVGVTLSGIRINYPAGWHTLWSGETGKLLQNSVGIDATDAEAIISFVR